MDEFIAILISLLLTAFFYGIFPLVFILTQKKLISRRTVRTRFIIATAAVGLVFFVLSENAGYRGSFAPALFWGYIYYRLALSRFRKRGILLEISAPSDEPAASASCEKSSPVKGSCRAATEGFPSSEPQEVSLSYTNDFQVPIREEDADGVISDVLYVYKTPKRLKYVLILLAVLLAASACLNAWQYSARADLSSEIETMKKEHSRELCEYYERGYDSGYDSGYLDGVFDEYNRALQIFG